jgi:hypothetical protein
MKKRLTAAAIAAFLGIVFLFAQGPVQKVRLWDTNLSHSLLLKWNEDRAAAYTMNWIGINADRTITLQGNPTLDDWFDQDYHIIATPTFAGVYLDSSTAAPFLKFTNRSDTERDPIIQFAVGATPVTKWTMGLDDSDVDKWKLTVGDEFGNHHDVIAISSGEGATPPVAEFTLIDSFAATSPRGICEDGIYLYYSDSTASQQLVKVDISTGAEITRSPDIGDDLYQCATDGTYVYVACYAASNIQKYLCSDLSYDSGSVAWAGNPSAVCYWSGYLYVANLNAVNIRKIRCSDMATIWTTGFALGGGVNEMARPVSLAVDGQYIYVQDCAYGNNRIVRLNMDGTWVDSVVVVNSMSYDSIAMWCAGDYLYNTAWYTSEYKIEKRNKSDLSISATFSIVPDQSQAGCQHGDYHYVVHVGNQFIYKYQYVTSDAAGESGIQFRLKDVYGVFNDIAKLTAAGRFGVGTTIPSEKIEAVGNIKATAGQFISTMATGTAPVVVSSTTVCPNLNAGLWDNYHLPALAVGDMIYGDGTATVAKLADVAAGSYLRSGGVVTAPLWSTLILPNAATAYRLLVATATNTIGELAAVGATGEYLKGNTGAIPSWATLNQAAVAGLTTADGPIFDHVHVTNDVIIDTSGKGIDFSAAHSAFAHSSNLFDYYEEGTWTPVRHGFTEVVGGGAITNAGYYIKIGGLRITSATITCTGGATIAASAGTSYLTGMPYVPDVGVGGSWVNLQTAATSGQIAHISTFMYIVTAWAAASQSWSMTSIAWNF